MIPENSEGTSDEIGKLPDNHFVNLDSLFPLMVHIDHSNTSDVSDLIMLNTAPGSIPIQFREMSSNSRNSVLLYTCLFIFAVFGNLSVFFSVLRQIVKFRIKTRITLLILHLSIADLIVTFFLIPMEVFWRISIQWYGGNFFCKFCQFLRAFGLYLSSMIIISISMDRYFALNHPLKIDGKKMVKWMLYGSWLMSALCSLPQSLIFSVKAHPIYASFQNCVSIGFFRTAEEEIIYNVFSITVMYFVPLAVILVTYSLILRKITRKTKEERDIDDLGSENLMLKNLKKPTHKTESRNNGQDVNSSSQPFQKPTSTISKPVLKLRLRCSDNARLTIVRARNRTLRLTLVIVSVFLLCSTPYILMVLWYMFDREGATKVDERLQDLLFMMVVGNSCANPVIYGSFTKGCNIFCGLDTLFRKLSDQRRSQRSDATFGSDGSGRTGVYIPNSNNRGRIAIVCSGMPSVGLSSNQMYQPVFTSKRPRGYNQNIL